MPRLRRSSISREIRTIRTSLSSIDNALQRLAPVLQRVASAPSGEPARRRPKLRLSPERRAALKLQGQYMGYIRNLKPREKARVKAFRVRKGIQAAISLAKRLMNG